MMVLDVYLLIKEVYQLMAQSANGCLACLWLLGNYVHGIINQHIITLLTKCVGTCMFTISETPWQLAIYDRMASQGFTLPTFFMALSCVNFP